MSDSYSDAKLSHEALISVALFPFFLTSPTSSSTSYTHTQHTKFCFGDGIARSAVFVMFRPHILLHTFSVSLLIGEGI